MEGRTHRPMRNGGKNGHTHGDEMTTREEVLALIADLRITRYRAARLAELDLSHTYAWLSGRPTLSETKIARLVEVLRSESNRLRETAPIP